MSTYSPNLRLELITTGDQAGTWGNTTNTNLGSLIEAAVSGYTSVSVTSANQALTALNGADDQSRNMTIALTTTTTANFNVYAPPAEKVYIIYNASAYTATLYNSTIIGNTTAAGTGVTIPAGRVMPVWTDGTNFRAQATHLPTLSLTVPLGVASGGTGGDSAASARSNLGLGTIAIQNANNVNITGGVITGIAPLAIAEGGTGANTASTARANLGLGSIATQNANAVSITGGSITGITDLAVADGGTGASDAATARTNLGLGTIATQNAASVSITGGSITGITDLAVADGGTGASDAATARTNLGLGTMATQNSNSVTITGGAISGVSISGSPSFTSPVDIPSGGTGATTAAGARTNLGLGTIATQNASGVSITGGSITGITDLAVADGGTGASDAATARSNLDVPSTTGSGASGTWGISISGNAATATSATTTIGNAGTATTLQTARTINGTSFNGSANITTASWGTARTLSFTGDATGSSSVDGSVNVATGLTLATVNSNVGSFGAGGVIPVITVNAKGLITSVVATPIAALGVGQLYIAYTSPTRQTDSNFVWGSITNKYTNSTGRPIQVSVGRNGQNGYRTVVWVDGVVVCDAQVDQYGGSESMGPVTVPNGSQYAVSVSGGAWCNYWTELR